MQLFSVHCLCILHLYTGLYHVFVSWDVNYMRLQCRNNSLNEAVGLHRDIHHDTFRKYLFSLYVVVYQIACCWVEGQGSLNFLQNLILPLVTYVKGHCHIWQLNFCALIWSSVCVLKIPCYSKDRWSVIKIRREFFVQDRVVKDFSCYLRNEQLKPHFLIFQRWGASLHQIKSHWRQ